MKKYRELLLKLFHCLRHLSCYKKRFALELNMTSLLLLTVILCYFFRLITFSNGLFVRATNKFMSSLPSPFWFCVWWMFTVQLYIMCYNKKMLQSKQFCLEMFQLAAFVQISFIIAFIWRAVVLECRVQLCHECRVQLDILLTIFRSFSKFMILFDK